MTLRPVRLDEPMKIPAYNDIPEAHRGTSPQAELVSTWFFEGRARLHLVLRGLLTDHDLEVIRYRVFRNHEDIDREREGWLADLRCRSDRDLKERPGVDRRAVLNELLEILGSYELPHEHKIAAAAWLVERSFELPQGGRG